MIKAILIIILLNISFLGVGGGLMYYGYQSDDTFNILMGGGFVGIMLLMDVPVSRWLLMKWFKRKSQKRRAANYEKSETGNFK